MSISIECPECDSTEIEQSSEHDCTLVSLDCAVHDFRCEQCGCLFIVEYAPCHIEMVAKGDNPD